jgi:hypothetical protein
MHALIISGILFISPSKPYSTTQAQDSVWFSSPRLIEVQNVGRNLVVKAKEEGLLHAVGLSGKDLTLRVQIVSDETYLALTKCPQAPLDFTYTPPRVRKVEDLALLSPCGFDRLGVVDPTLFEKAVLQAEARLSRTGFRVLKSEWKEGQRSLILAGALPPARKIDEVLGDLKPLLRIQHQEGPRPGRTLIFELGLLEFSRTAAQRLGVRFPKSITIKPLDPGLSNWVTDLSDGALDLGADFGESLGIGRILARPQVRTKPGERALFQSGGEIPIRNSSFHGSQTTWKSYGLLLDLQPDANIETGASEVALTFKVELSEPDQSTAIDGVPGMIIRRLESRFDLRVNETTVLTTMIQTRSGTTKDGVAGLIHIPMLGNLLSNHGKTEQDSELWFSIRPRWDEIPVNEKARL